MSLKYHAVILAGGKAPWLKELTGTDVRCLARIKGKRLLDYIAEALKASGRIDGIMLAVSSEGAEQLEGSLPEGVELCLSDTDLPSTCLRAAEALGALENPRVLFICDDIPMVTGEAISRFLEACDKFPNGDLYYPIIPKAVCEQTYPEAKRTYGTLKNGTFTGGNMMVVNSLVIPRGQVKAKEIFARRKQPWKLCSWLGWGFIFKLLFKQLDIPACEQRVTELMEMESHCIIAQDASIGMDVDKPDDLLQAEKYL